MGTDIHMIAEVFVTDEHDRTKGRWVHVPNPIRDCFWCEGTGKRLVLWNNDQPPVRYDPPLITDEDCYWCSRNPDRVEDPDDKEYLAETWVPEVGKSREEWYDDRNYDVFAILADVRNGYGFAGVDTGDAWPIIAEPRGVPDDCSPEVAKYMEHYDHTPSYVYLDEIARFDWGYQRKSRGVVDAEQYAVFKEQGQPNSWSGDVNGGRVRKVSNAVMDRMIADGEDLDHVYTKVEWVVTAGERCERFLDAMKELAAVCGENRARIVFYFDS